jgi:hypothetical protein
MPIYRGTFYRGLDRDEWCDFIRAHNEGTFTSEMSYIWDKFIHMYDYKRFLRDYDDAVKLYEYLGRTSRRHDLLAVHTAGYPDVMLPDSSSYSFLGYDITVFGPSILASGLFQHPELFAEWGGKINNNGLFSDPHTALQYAQAYQELARDGYCEFSGQECVIWEIGKVIPVDDKQSSIPELESSPISVATRETPSGTLDRLGSTEMFTRLNALVRKYQDELRSFGVVCRVDMDLACPKVHFTIDEKEIYGFSVALDDAGNCVAPITSQQYGEYLDAHFGDLVYHCRCGWWEINDLEDRSVNPT